jgi:hypothetical protein
MPHHDRLTAEDIAYWYFRLNGFLLLSNFIVHPDRAKDGTRTDIDVLGVRFSHRREHLNDPMHDDEWVYETDKSWIIFAEAKTGIRDFNSSWARRDRQVMESFLALVGALPESEWNRAADSLYRDGFYDGNSQFRISTFLLNDDPDNGVLQSDHEPIEKDAYRLTYRWPRAPRTSLQRALRFIHSRLRRFETVKTDHGQWNASGHRLWDIYRENRQSPHAFEALVLCEIGATSHSIA